MVVEKPIIIENKDKIESQRKNIKSEVPLQHKSPLDAEIGQENIDDLFQDFVDFEEKASNKSFDSENDMFFYPN